jgi:hypothetical protein
VYQEILGEAGEAVSPLPVSMAGTENLLVGGNNRVWQYALKRKGKELS